MPRISLTILSPAREFIDIIPDPWEVKYLDEVKGDCSGSFKVPFDYKRLVDTPAIKQKRNVVQVVVDGKVEGAWLMRNWHVVLSGSGEKAALYWEFSGPGLREWLHDAVVYPASVFHAVSQPLPLDAQIIVGASPDNSGVDTGTTQSGGGTPTTPTGTMPNGPSGFWALVFQDEFEGTSIDTTKWNLLNNVTANGTACLASNVTVANSIATLTLSGASTGAQLQTDGEFQGTDHFRAQVGDYVEFRAKFYGNGTQIYNWPALWTSGQSWPQNGEIDIAEAMKQVTYSYHGPGPGSYGLRPSGYYGDQFHTYGAHRKATSVDIYWDGVLIGTMPTSDSGGGHGLIITMAGSGDGSIAGPLLVGGHLAVDYARVFRPSTAPPTTVSTDYIGTYTPQ